MQTKAKKRRKKQIEMPEPEPKKPQMPDKVLRNFLEEKVNLSTLNDISKIRAGFLWATETIERYRINVWQTTYELGQFCPNTKIIHSFFVHYYPEDQRVVNKTEEPVDKHKDLLGRIRT
tara:strand:+ start:132 stop:488 length:357 start_codon:yes stop_codon:yes gene_type:complete